MDHSNDIDEQEVMESFRKMKRHVGIVYFMNTLRHDSYRDIDDPNYRDPTNAEVVEVIDTMAFLGFKKTDVAKLLGIRTVSKDKKTVTTEIIDEAKEKRHSIFNKRAAEKFFCRKRR